jgi:CDP-paratose 2-epimerase
MRVLITGICGFVGSRIAHALREQMDGITINGIDNLMRQGSEINRRALQDAGIDVRHGDVRLRSDLETIPRVDWIIDASANPRVLAGVDGATSSRQLVESNLWGTVEVLEYCRTHGSGLVLLSTSRVFSIEALASLPLVVDDAAFVLDPAGDLPRGVSRAGIDAEFSTDAPVSLYGATKLVSERIALEYAATFGFPIWINRCGILGGAGQFGTADQGIVAYWINAHRRRRPLRYIGFEGTGHQSRDVLHPSDLASLIARQMRSARSGGRRLYVVAGGAARLFSLARLTAWCDDRFGRHAVAGDGTSRRFDVPWFSGDASLAAGDFDWTPEVGLRDILHEIALHAEAHPDWLEVSGNR